MLQDGSVIIAASVETVRLIRDNLGASDSSEDLWRLLADDSATFSASVIGWTSSPVASDLRAARNALSVASERLSGDLNLLSTSGNLVERIAEDGYSPKNFQLLLSDEPMDLFRKENSSLPADQLFWKLTSHLYGNASAYFAGRYFDALRKIEEFTKVAANALSALASHELVLLARSVSTVGNAETLTGDMEATLDRIAPLLPGEILSQLRASLGQIEILIAKDGALERLERFKDGA